MSNLKNLSSLTYSPDDSDSGVQVIMKDDTAWVSQKGMAELFGIDQNGVSGYLKNIFDSGELDENSSNMQKMHIANSSKPVDYYSLDVVISVGYRANSKKATQFRIWVTKILSQFIKDGYVLNKAVLRDDPSKLSKLAADIRELRANEKNVFAAVKECFKISASDYEPSSEEVKKFYMLLQDKFHHAITKMTAAKLVMDRADATVDNMGLHSFKELMPTQKEAKTGKNYLSQSELYRMYLLSEQFLLFAESSALMNKTLTMKGLHQQLDNLLELNGYPVFDGYRDYIKDDAMRHAEVEHKKYIDIKKLEMLGVNVDIFDYEIGEYEENFRYEMDAISMQKLRKHFKEKEALQLEAPSNNMNKLNESLKVALNYNPKA